MKTITRLTFFICILFFNSLIGQNNYYKIQTLLTTAEEAKDSAQYEEALELLTDVNKIYATKKIDTTVIRIYNLFASTHTAMGDFDSSLDYCNKIIKQCSDNVKKSRAYSETLKIIGGTYIDKKLFKKGITYIEQSLKLSEDLYPKGHFSLGIQYLETGINYHKTRQLNKAEDNFNLALDILNKHDSEHIERIRSLYFYMAKNYYLLRKTKLGFKYANLTLTYSTKLHGKDSSEVAMSYLIFADLYKHQNKFDQAIEYILMAEKIYILLGMKNHEDMADVYYSLSQNYAHSGQFDNSILYHKKALNIYIKLKNSNSKYAIARCYYDIGSSYVNLRQLKKAKEYLNNAKSYIKKENLTHVFQRPIELFNSQIDIAMTRCYSPFFDKDKVIAILKKVQKVYTQFGKDELLLKCNLEIANIYFANEDYVKMRPAVFETLKVSKKLNNQVVTVLCNLLLANGYINQNKLDNAQVHLILAAQQLNYHTGELSLNFKAGAKYQTLNFLLKTRRTYYQKKYEETKNLKFLDSIYSNNDNYIALQEYSNSFKTSAVDKNRSLQISMYFYENCIKNYIKHEQHKSLIKAYDIVEKTKARQLKINFNATNALKFGQVPDSLFKKEAKLKKDISHIEKIIFETANDSLLSNYENALFKLKRQQNQLYELFFNSYSRYHNLKFNNKPVDIIAIQNCLQEDQTVVEYFTGTYKIFIFTITKNKFNVKVVDITPELRPWISDLRNSIYSFDDENQIQKYLTSAHNLYNVLIAPVKKDLKHKLIIIPDDVLNYIPFETLLEEKVEELNSYKDLPYLIKKHQISYNYSATLYHQLLTQKNEAAKENLLAFAPSFKDNKEKFESITARRNGFENLLYNIPEAEIAHDYISGHLFKGNAATEENFLKNAGDYKIIHLSTHAKSNDELGDYSFIAMSKVNDSIDDANRIYTSELYNLNLKADMVVLSACETGLGELQKGEGIISLARAFTYAGAKSTINSLWSVNDASTKALMEEFYKNIKAGKTKDQALHEAKLSYLENEDMDAPYFWASFIAMGNMEPIILSSSTRYYWLLLLLIPAFIFIYKRRKTS